MTTLDAIARTRYCGPNRVLINSTEAISLSKAVEKGIFWGKGWSIFIRDDGWSLAAPQELTSCVLELWEDGWVHIGSDTFFDGSLDSKISLLQLFLNVVEIPLNKGQTERSSLKLDFSLVGRI